MLTQARIFSALAATCMPLLALPGADTMPTWVRLVIGALGLFSVALVATSGPIQNSAGDNSVAKSVVADMKMVREDIAKSNE